MYVPLLLALAHAATPASVTATLAVDDPVQRTRGEELVRAAGPALLACFAEAPIPVSAWATYTLVPGGPAQARLGSEMRSATLASCVGAALPAEGFPAVDRPVTVQVALRSAATTGAAELTILRAEPVAGVLGALKGGGTLTGVGGPLHLGGSNLAALSANQEVPVRVTLTLAATRGNLDGAAATMAAAPRSGPIRTCYSDALARAPGLAGTMGGTLQVGEDGAVGKVEVSADDLGDDALAACVIATLDALVLGAGGAGRATWEVTLQPRSPAGAAVGGDPIILGALDKADLDAVITANLPRLEDCYLAGLAATPGLAGQVTVKLVVAADGAVSSATTKATTPASPEVEACINARLRTFTFPPPRGGGIVIASYPLTFRPE